MVRRTKAEALQTRHQIVAAARRVFHERGVRCSSLEQIAMAAGVTRGAVYWHFKDKSALFFAVRNEGYEAFSQRIVEALGNGVDSNPLEAVQRALQSVFEVLEGDETARQTMEILYLRCEYTDELADALQVVFDSHRHLQQAFESAYRLAHEVGQLRAGASPRELALESVAFLTGLIMRWIVDRNGEIARSVRALIASHVALRRA